MSYAEKYKDPRWQKKRLEVLERDEWCCRLCTSDDRNLQVHHCYYERDADPWDYPDYALVTLCEGCHDRLEEAIKWVRAEGSKDYYILLLVEQIKKLTLAGRSDTLSMLLCCVETMIAHELDLSREIAKAQE